MKINISTLVSLLLVVSFSSCFFKKEADSIPVITISVKDAENNRFKTWFKKVKYTQLKISDSTLVGQLDKLVVTDTEYYVMDRKQDRIWVFDKQGSYVRSSISLYNNGGGGYLSLLDFHVDEYQKRVYILDPVRRQVIVSNLDFEYIEKIRLDENILPISTFSLIGKYYFFVYQNVMKIYDPLNEKIISTIDMKATSIFRNYPIIPIGSDHLFIPSFPLNAVYRISDQTCSKIYSLDFGSYTYQATEDERVNSRTFYERMERDMDSKAFVVNILPLDDCLFLFYYHKKRLYVTRYNTKSHHLESSFSEPASKEQFPLTTVSNKSNIYYICMSHDYPYFALENFDPTSEIDLDGNPVVIEYSAEKD